MESLDKDEAGKGIATTLNGKPILDLTINGAAVKEGSGQAAGSSKSGGNVNGGKGDSLKPGNGEGAEGREEGQFCHFV